MRPQCVAVSRGAFRAGCRAERTGDVRDPGVTEADEVGDDLGGGPGVVDLHRGVCRDARAAIHQHEGKSLAAHGRERRVRHPARRDEETVRLPLAQDAKRCLLPLGLVVSIAEHELVPALARRLLRAADDRRKEWVGDVRDEHPESARPS